MYMALGEVIFSLLESGIFLFIYPIMWKEQQGSWVKY